MRISDWSSDVCFSDLATLLTWREQGRFRLGIGSGDPAEGDMVVETMVAPTHPSIGQRLVDIPFLQKIRARIIGLDRPAHDPGPDLASVRVRDRKSTRLNSSH